MTTLRVKSKTLTVLIHILVWTTLILLQLLSLQSMLNNRPPDINIPDFFPKFNYLRFFIQTLAIITLYYLNYSLLMPKLLFRDKVKWYIISLIGTLIVFFIINQFIDIAGNPHKQFFRRIPMPFFIYLFIIAISTTIRLAQKWYENENHKKTLVHEKVNSELSLLKSQINPHFLFNTLNGIYSLANSKSDKTAPAIVKLSQLMRYMLHDSKHDFVPLSKEIEYIQTFIELEKMRLFDNITVEYSIKGNAENDKIRPLLLIPIIENAFKHGIDSTKNCLIKINIFIKDSRLDLKVENDIFPDRLTKEKSGFGLATIRRRLELEYPDAHTLYTFEENNKYFANLFINLA
ncbi:MAG TPA: hypothetical protein DCQ24_15300 [Bacteroidales bacterium]|nr:hypothetical protein [Bacteroidales bacterium]